MFSQGVAFQMEGDIMKVGCPARAARASQGEDADAGPPPYCRAGEFHRCPAAGPCALSGGGAVGGARHVA